MAHFLPLQKEGKTAADLALTFAREIWKFHGLPTDIVSDRDSRFTSDIWKEFLRLSGIQPQMSTAFHTQTDEQMERLNQMIDAYLQAVTAPDHRLPSGKRATKCRNVALRSAGMRKREVPR